MSADIITLPRRTDAPVAVLPRPHVGMRSPVSPAERAALGDRSHIDPSLPASLASKSDMLAAMAAKLAEEAKALGFTKQAVTFREIADICETCGAEFEASV